MDEDEELAGGLPMDDGGGDSETMDFGGIIIDDESAFSIDDLEGVEDMGAVAGFSHTVSAHDRADGIMKIALETAQSLASNLTAHHPPNVCVCETWGFGDTLYVPRPEGIETRLIEMEFLWMLIGRVIANFNVDKTDGDMYSEEVHERLVELREDHAHAIMAQFEAEFPELDEEGILHIEEKVLSSIAAYEELTPSQSIVMLSRRIPILFYAKAYRPKVADWTMRLGMFAYNTFNERLSGGQNFFPPHGQ